MYSVDYQVLGKTPSQGFRTHRESQSLGLDSSRSSRDVYEFDLTWKSFTVKIHLRDLKHRGQRNRWGQQLSLGPGQISYVMQEELHSAV